MDDYENEYADLLGAMFADEEEPVEIEDGESRATRQVWKNGLWHDVVGPAEPDPLRNLGKTVEINIAGTKVMVPSQAYVVALERTLADQGRLIRRMSNEVKHMRYLINRHASDLHAIQAELDRKVDLRTMP